MRNLPLQQSPEKPLFASNPQVVCCKGKTELIYFQHFLSDNDMYGA
jgi:hypothetical protein